MDEIGQRILEFKGVAVAAWFVLFFLLERLAPSATTDRGWFGDWQRLLTNGGLFVMNGILSLLVVLPISAWAAGFDLGLRPEWWTGWQGLILDLLVLDFLIYWWHRANHVIPILWRFHEVHHLDQFLDTSSAVRFHFGEVLLSATFRAAVIVAWGIPFETVILFEVAVLLAAIFHHSNVKLPAGVERVLSWLIITPSIHWVHHHAVRKDTDSNYGTILSFWDRLFGSRSPNIRVGDMAIGTEGRRERPFLGLLLSPFRASR